MNKKECLPSLNEVGQSFDVLQLLLVSYLLIENYKFSLNISPLYQLSVQTLFNNRNLFLLENMGILLKLFSYFLLHETLLLDLY